MNFKAGNMVGKQRGPYAYFNKRLSKILEIDAMIQRVEALL